MGSCRGRIQFQIHSDPHHDLEDERTTLAQRFRVVHMFSCWNGSAWRVVSCRNSRAEDAVTVKQTSNLLSEGSLCSDWIGRLCQALQL